MITPSTTTPPTTHPPASGGGDDAVPAAVVDTLHTAAAHTAVVAVAGAHASYDPYTRPRVYCP